MKQLLKYTSALILLPLLFVVFGVFSQVQADTYEVPDVRGRVVTDRGVPVPGMIVIWKANQDDGQGDSFCTDERWIITDPDGRYNFEPYEHNENCALDPDTGAFPPGCTEGPVNPFNNSDNCFGGFGCQEGPHQIRLLPASIPDGYTLCSPNLPPFELDNIAGHEDMDDFVLCAEDPPPEPDIFACREVVMTPDNSVLQAGFSRRLTSTVTRPILQRAWFAVYNRDNREIPNNPESPAKPVCVPDPGAVAAGGCPANTKHLIFEGTETQTQGEVTLEYQDLAVIDKNYNDTLATSVSITAFHTDTNNAYAGSVRECIKNLNLIGCGGINPNTVTLSQAVQTVAVRATSIPASGLESALFGLYQGGNRVCADPDLIDNYTELAIGPAEDCDVIFNVQHRQVMVRGVVSGTGNQKVAIGTFKYGTMVNFIQANTDYNFTAFVTVNGQQVGSQSQCVGSLRLTGTATPPPTPPTVPIQCNSQCITTQQCQAALGPDYSCVSVSPIRRCRLTSNPGSATCQPPATPTPTPTVTPTPTTPPSNPPGPICLRIQLNSDRNPPQIGDSVNLTCGRVNYPGVSYQFRYRRNAGSWQNVSSSTVGSNISANFTITDSGTFDAQCRLCIGGTNNIQGTCQDWQEVNTR